MLPPAVQRPRHADRIDVEGPVVEPNPVVAFGQAFAVRGDGLGGVRRHRCDAKIALEKTEETLRTNRDFADGRAQQGRLQDIPVQAESNTHQSILTHRTL